MKKQNVLGLMLATTVALSALAGCSTPAITGAGANTRSNVGTKPAPQAPAGSQTAGGQATGSQSTGSQAIAPAPAAQAREGTAEALSDEKDMEAYDVMANDAEAGRTVMMLGALKPGDRLMDLIADASADVEASGEARAEGGWADRGAEARAGRLGKLRAELGLKLKEREGKKAEKLKDRLEKLKGDREKLQEKAKGGKWVDAGDGTEVKSFDFAVDKSVKAGEKTVAMSRTVTMKRVRDIETKDLISSHIAFSQTLPNGMTRKSERNKVLNTADGTYAVTFHSELVQKDGTQRVADWTKTIAVDGTVTGTGTITWTDAAGVVTKKTTITLGGTEEDTAATAGGVTVDGDAPEAAEGTQAELTATAEAVVGDAEVSEATESEDAEDESGDEDEAEDEDEAKATVEAEASAT